MRHPEERQADHHRHLYADLTADIASGEDVQALKWAAANGHEHFVGELLRLDQVCHDLIRADAPEADVRNSIETFINRVRAMRLTCRERREA